MKRLWIVIFMFFGITICCCGSLLASAQQDISSRISSAIDGIIEWKKDDVGSEKDGFLLNDEFLTQAGTTAGDWYPIALGRLGITDNATGYLAVLNDLIDKRYATKDKLDRAKATEWHRIALATLASGGNPRRVGEKGSIDLIADGTYDRRDENGDGILGKQGINGFIWGLITLDSMYYEVPKDAFYSRDDIILNILNRRLADGGWALTGEESDPDITAMALQALAPYYNSEKNYEYLDASSETIIKKARQAIDDGLSVLSELQLEDGDFSSWGTVNSESVSQVIIALCSLGIDPFNDERFIKGEKTLFDGLMKYKNSDGGFLHSFVFDNDNPTADPAKSNSMASEQALLALTSLKRLKEGKRRLYDFRPEQSEETKTLIKRTQEEIKGLDEFSPNSEIQRVYDLYNTVSASERSYVTNYAYLAELMEFAGLEFAEEEIEYNSGDAGIITPITYFTESDKRECESLPLTLTGEYRAQVLRLWQKIICCEDFQDKNYYYIKLEKAKNEIDDIAAETEYIKNEIKNKLYPFDSISLKDRNTVNSIYERFIALSEYDRGAFEKSDVEGLIKAKKQVDTLFAATVTVIVLSVVALGIIIFVVLHVRKRKKEKLSRQMTESEE